MSELNKGDVVNVDISSENTSIPSDETTIVVTDKVNVGKYNGENAYKGVFYNKSSNEVKTKASRAYFTNQDVKDVESSIDIDDLDIENNENSVYLSTPTNKRNTKSAEVIRESEGFEGGSIVTKMQDDGTGNEYGPYKYLVSPPSAGRNWYYLGRASGSGSNSDLSESVGNESIELDDVPEIRDKLNTDYTGWTKIDGNTYGYLVDGKNIKYNINEKPNGEYQILRKYGGGKNELLDIIESKSELEQIIYDYDSKTEDIDIKFESLNDLNGLRGYSVMTPKDGGNKIVTDGNERHYITQTNDGTYQIMSPDGQSIIKGESRQKVIERFGYDVLSNKPRKSNYNSPTSYSTKQKRNLQNLNNKAVTESGTELILGDKTKINYDSNGINNIGDDLDNGYTAYETDKSGYVVLGRKGKSSRSASKLKYVTDSGSIQFIDDNKTEFDGGTTEYIKIDE